MVKGRRKRSVRRSATLLFCEQLSLRTRYTVKSGKRPMSNCFTRWLHCVAICVLVPHACVHGDVASYGRSVESGHFALSAARTFCLFPVRFEVDWVLLVLSKKPAMLHQPAQVLS